MESRNLPNIKDFFFLLVTLLAPGSVFNCSPEDGPLPASDCSSSAATFTQVHAIITNSCTTGSGCHGTNSAQGPGELLTYTQVHAARNTIKTAVASGRMPLNGNLPASQRDAIICWIENGAQNN